MPDRALVLDTHVWVWVVEGRRDVMSDAVIETIEQGAAAGELVVSAISIWEVAMLEAKGRLTFAQPIEDWVSQASRAPGLRVYELTSEIAIASTRLPGEPHGDPADRIIIATARALGARVVSADRHIVQYAAAGYVQAVNAGE